jgi:hypothetical protein
MTRKDRANEAFCSSDRGKGNYGRAKRVYKSVKYWLSIASLLMVTTAGGFDFYSSARQKVDSIESGHLPPGARVDLSLRELNAFAEKEVPTGVSDPKLVLTEPDTVTGTALVDFGKLRRAQGYQPGWLMSKLLDGERPVSATARIHSGGGKITVEVLRAAISGLEIDGGTLDFVIQNFIVPFYPEAMVGRPVAMGYRIDRLQLAPAGVAVLIGH